MKLPIDIGLLKQKVPLTAKMVIATLAVGATIWGLSNLFVHRIVENVFTDYFIQMTRHEVDDARKALEKQMEAYKNTVGLCVTQSRFQEYIRRQKWDTGNVIEVYYQDEFPSWLPDQSLLRPLATPSFVLLLDSDGQTREIYEAAPGETPPPLLHPTASILQMSKNNIYFVLLDTGIYLLSSESISGSKETVKATILFGSPIDERFLENSAHTLTHARIVALISTKDNTVLASNNTEIIRRGDKKDSLSGKYLITETELKDYGDTGIELVTIIPLETIRSLSKPVLRTETLEHTATAVIFILSFTILMVWLTKRIERLTEEVTDFSRQALGGVDPEPGHGDQIDILEKRFQHLTEEITQAHRKLEHRVEERTAALKEERDRAQRYFDIAGAMLLALDSDGTIILINKRGCEILGCTEQDALGESWFDKFIPSDKSKEVKIIFKKLMSGEGPEFSSYENSIKTIGGQERLVFWYNTVLKDDKGAIIGTLSSGEDITERRKSEYKLNELILTLNTLIENLPEGVVLIEPDHRISMTNTVARHYLDKIAGISEGDYLHRLAGRPIEEMLAHPPTVLWHNISVNENNYEVAGRMIGSGASASGIAFVIRDVTEEQARDQRIQSQDRLAAVGQLAAGIAHDFNNLLTIINGYAEILSTDTEQSKKSKQWIDAIMQSGQKASDLIHQILDFSRKTVGEMQTIDLVQFVKNFLKFIERTIPENIFISFEYDPLKYFVKADVTKLQQVLANLVVNARDAMPEGGKLGLKISRITLKPGESHDIPEMEPGEWISLSVSDTGTGIDTEVLPRIFEPFFTTKATGKGTGLGLSQVYGLVKQHNGHIDVSTGKQGTTFTVYLHAQHETTGEPIPEPKLSIPKGNGQTVVIVEDDESVRDLLENMLTDLGYKILTAVNGKDALDLFEKIKGKADLVITDIVMPEANGIMLSKSLKAIYPELPILALSGYTFDGKQDELTEAGFSDLVKKPFKIQTIANAVSRVLDRN